MRGRTRRSVVRQIDGQRFRAGIRSGGLAVAPGLVVCRNGMAYLPQEGFTGRSDMSHDAYVMSENAQGRPRLNLQAEFSATFTFSNTRGMQAP